MSILSVKLDIAAVRDCPGNGGKSGIFRMIGEIAKHCYSLDPESVSRCLAAREALGSTGFGRKIAIPHAKLADLERCVGIFLRLSEPVAFDAHDGKPVDLIFTLLSPEKGGIEHLRALAEVSRFLRDDNMVAKLRGATGQDALYALLSKQREQRAA